MPANFFASAKTIRLLNEIFELGNSVMTTQKVEKFDILFYFLSSEY